MATKGTRWVAERCTDLLPDLLRLAAAEARQHDPRALDLAAARRTAAALAAVSGSGSISENGLRAVS
jgi:hypothetical protein